jgi:hypothetical protein
MPRHDAVKCSQIEVEVHKHTHISPVAHVTTLDNCQRIQSINLLSMAIQDEKNSRQGRSSSDEGLQPPTDHRDMEAA